MLISIKDWLSTCNVGLKGSYNHCVSSLKEHGWLSL